MTDAHRRAPTTAAVYGTILVMAVVASVSEDKAANAIEIDEAVLLTSAAFSLAHVYAGVLSRRLEDGSPALPMQLRAAIAEEWPMLQAAGAPSVALIVTWFADLPRATGVALALGVGLVQLFGWGVAVARHHGHGGIWSFASGFLNVSIGLLVVLVKVVVH